jgi:hypothetical protein
VAATETRAVFLRGENAAGMEFRGELAGVTADTLILRDGSSDSSLQMGVPFSSIGTLHLSLPDTPDASTNRSLESLLPVIPLMNRPSHESLLAYLGRRAGFGDWTDVYRWTQQLESAAADEALLLEIRLLKARSLHALGLHRLMEETLSSLGEQISPIKATPLYCLLRATALARKAKFPEARFWARLPFLQIPVSRDPAMEQLANLFADLDQRVEPAIP